MELLSLTVCEEQQKSFSCRMCGRSKLYWKALPLNSDRSETMKRNWNYETARSLATSLIQVSFIALKASGMTQIALRSFHWVLSETREAEQEEKLCEKLIISFHENCYRFAFDERRMKVWENNHSVVFWRTWLFAFQLAFSLLTRWDELFPNLFLFLPHEWVMITNCRR